MNSSKSSLKPETDSLMGHRAAYESLSSKTPLTQPNGALALYLGPVLPQI